MPLREPTIIDIQGRIRTVPGAERGRTPYAEADVLGARLVESLNALRADCNAALAALSTGETSPVYYEDLPTGTSGAQLVVVHNLGRRVRWAVVDWVPTISNNDVRLERDASSTDVRLVLRSYVAGSVTLRVW